jgi:hypothetical protein
MFTDVSEVRAASIIRAIAPNVVVGWLTLIRIREFLGPNLGPDDQLC